MCGLKGVIMAIIKQPHIPKFIDKVISFAENRIGGTMEPARLLLWAPKSFISSMILEGLVAHKKGRVSPRLLKLVRIQVSLLVSCPFCIDMNSSKYRNYDITDEEIRAMQKLIPLKEVLSLTHAEKMTLYYIRGIVRTPIKQNPKVVNEMTKLFNEQELATIITTIAQVDYWTRVIQGFGIKPVGFLDSCDWESK